MLPGHCQNCLLRNALSSHHSYAGVGEQIEPIVDELCALLKRMTMQSLTFKMASASIIAQAESFKLAWRKPLGSRDEGIVASHALF